MVALPRCPDLDQLRLYLHARLREDEVAILEEHLSGCNHCTDSLDNLTSSDIIAIAIREHAAAGVRLDSDEVTDLMSRLRRNPPPEIGSSTGSDITDRNEDSQTEARAGDEVFDFFAPAQAADELGRLGPYRILGLIGSGGMGIVFRAEDPHLERVVAVKVMKRSLVTSDADRKRFLREARTIAAIEHDHVVVIHQAGVDRGVLYLVMPLLKGESLEDRLRRDSRLSVGEALRIARGRPWPRRCSWPRARSPRRQARQHLARDRAGEGEAPRLWTGTGYGRHGKPDGLGNDRWYAPIHEPRADQGRACHSPERRI